MKTLPWTREGEAAIIISDSIPKSEIEKVKQPEGLCLMEYKCGKCGKVEILWNSRTRVSPYMINCSSCDGEMKHINWNSDKYAPNHQPQKGERIFVDWSREAEEKMRRKQIDKCWDLGKYPMKERTDLWGNKKEALQYYINMWEFGQPTVEII